MKFNPKAKLDRSQVEDRRGQRRSGGGLPGLGGGGGGLPFPTGGGIGGIVVLIIILIIAAKCGGLGGLTGGGESDDNQTAESDSCETGADANERQDCAILASVNSIQAFWTDALPEQTDTDYEVVKYIPFGGSTDSGCGQASSAMGPFYCPVDKLVYLDLTFFEDMLVGQLGGKGGDFAEAYVMAHEYGHHVQDLLGTLGANQSRETGPKSPSVRIELQADCYAGIWAHSATTVENSDGEVFITELTDEDISEAIDAATAVGDDRIQQQTSGRVNEEQWTHGSAAERVAWFKAGLASGDMDDCDTFAANAL